MKLNYERKIMSKNTKMWILTITEAIPLGITSGAFFFTIIGVFGLGFAVLGLLLAICLATAIFYKRPSGEQAQ
jgi:hypothetical protein